MIKKQISSRLLKIILVILATFAISGCNLVLFQPKGIIAFHEKWLLIDAVLLMLMIVIPVIILTFMIVRYFRASNQKAHYAPEWGHNTILELVWWAIPTVIIIILAVMTWRSTHALDPYKPLKSNKKPLTIQVVALSWKWLFIYPEQHIATINFVQFPINTPINFQVSADAAMNSFQIPQLAGQIYAMNGMQTKLHIMANQVGDYRGFSASYSGDGFAGMKFIAKASSKADFDQWVNKVRQSPNKLSADYYNQQLLKRTSYAPVQYFSWVTHDLFKKIIIKYMLPNTPVSDGAIKATKMTMKSK